jgi:ribonuclease P protein component
VKRLKTRPQFQAALAGKTLSKTPHFALHACSLEHAAGVLGGPVTLPLFPVNDVWVGAMVPKRWAKRAVTRNAIKRLIYGVSSEFADSLNLRAHVVRLRMGFDRGHYVSATSDALRAAVQSELQMLFRNLQVSAPK